MSVAEAVELAHRRLALEAAVDALTLPSKAETPDGGRAEVLSLIESCEDAQVSNDGEGYRSTTLASVRSPARLSATEVLVMIDRLTGSGGGRDRRERLRAWAVSEQAGSSASLGVVDEAATLAEQCVTACRAVLEPRRYLGLRGATCPECRNVQVVSPGNRGEDVIEPALAADLRTGIVSCAVEDCGAAWPVDALESLAGILAQQGRETLTADDAWPGEPEPLPQDPDDDEDDDRD